MHYEGIESEQIKINHEYETIRDESIFKAHELYQFHSVLTKRFNVVFVAIGEDEIKMTLKDAINFMLYALLYSLSIKWKS